MSGWQSSTSEGPRFRRIWRFGRTGIEVIRRADLAAGERFFEDGRLFISALGRILSDPFERRTALRLYESIASRLPAGIANAETGRVRSAMEAALDAAFRSGLLVILMRAERVVELPVLRREAEGWHTTAQGAAEAKPHARAMSAGSGIADAGSDEDTVTTQVKTWVEVQLVDMAGNPMKSARYTIKLPDGSLQEGFLSQEGIARCDNIDPGMCEISFPDLDAEAWEPA
ncbi:MAG TPA: hypothetical protein VFQ79_02790 [Bryobacteraceae bacterium]|nr:hypothetical protein [Bryobacteraceae bacterium]